MLLQIFIILLPLFILISCGFIMGRLVKLSEDTLVRVLTDFFMPILVFTSLYNSPVSISDMLNLSGSVFVMVIITLAAALIYAHLAGIDKRPFTPPIIFMNSGFLGIPVMQLWGGNQAMNIIIIYDQIQTFLIFTLGYLILEGGFSLQGIKASIKSPILWAVITGFTSNILRIPIPEVLLGTFSFAGSAALPLALSARKKETLSIHVFWGIFLRVVIGFISGLIAVKIFGITGTMKIVIIVIGALPSAIFAYILPARLGFKSSTPREIVIISTILGIVTIPLSFYLAELI
ncbi:MAG: AEC family transporter [Spirochaetota bacterium]|nr:AEC family transporter [Spirochaetota bacterium]